MGIIRSSPWPHGCGGDRFFLGTTMHAATPLRGEATIPGDKSISHRALMIAALATGTSHVRGLSTAADPRSTASCLRSLGVRIDERADATAVQGAGLEGLREATTDLDCGNSGTTMRLLSGILAGQPFRTTLTGDASLHRRPMERVAVPLRQMGADIETQVRGRPPLRIHGRRPLKAIDFVAPVASAQVKSAVLLAGLFADGTTKVTEPAPTRDHTERLLGLPSHDTPQGKVTTISAGMRVDPFEMTIPGDCSAAVFLIGAAAIVPGSELLIRNVGVNPHRARVLEILAKWGVNLSMHDRRASGGEPVADLAVRSGTPSGTLEVSDEDVPALIDEIPALALTAFGTGNGFRVSGAAELRAKESDRISTIVQGLRALGVAVEESADGFAFESKNDVLGTTIRTDADHRIAMAFSIAALRYPTILIDDPTCVAVSFPEFFQTLRRLQGRSE